MREIRIHCRGGQGGLTAARILANAALKEGKIAQAFPEFGPERRGAPVRSYLRLDDEVIWLRTPVQTPDLVMVLDASLLSARGTLAGIKPGGVLLVNSPNPPRLSVSPNLRVAWVDASRIAHRLIGRSIPNTAMLGAFCKMEDTLSLHGVEEAVCDWFEERHAEENVAAARAAWEEVETVKVPPKFAGTVAHLDERCHAFLTQYPRVAISRPKEGHAGRTGTWRIKRPVVDESLCRQCGVCIDLCPDGVIETKERGVFIDLDYCKGCGICVEECRFNAISFEEEL